MEPTQLAFWGAMSGAVLVGLVTAYPINVWMVQKRLKHGMGTQRALGMGGMAVHPKDRKAADSAPKAGGRTGGRRTAPKTAKSRGA